MSKQIAAASKAARAPNGGHRVPAAVWYTLGGLAIVVGVWLVYAPALRDPFVFDDPAAIERNDSIRRLWPLVGDADAPGPLNPSSDTPVHGRPLVNLSLAVNYYFGGLDPFGYRLVDLAAHALAALLLWRIVARTLRLEYFAGRFDRADEPLGFAAALVWALHPVNSESVVYVTQRTELLMGLAFLATVYAALRYWAADRRPTRIAWLVAAIVASACGMLCKEMMASVPAVLLLFERTFLAGTFRGALRRSWPLYLGLALGWIPLLALNFGGPRTPAAGFGLGVPAHVWWLTQCKVLFLYLKLAVWPWPLLIHYEIPRPTTLAAAWPWVLAAGLLFAATIVLVWRRSPLGFVAATFVAVLSPTLLIPLIHETAAERRLYVPLAALVPLVVVGAYVVVCRCAELWAGRAAGARRGATALFSAALAALVIGFGWLCHQRLEAYDSELALWKDTVAHSPDDPMAQHNLALMLEQAGRNAEAIEHFTAASRLDPESSWIHYNLARALETAARPADAIDQYRETLRIEPDHAGAHTNLGALLANFGRTSEAVEHYQAAIEADPDMAQAHNNLGILLANLGYTHQAIKHLQVALRLEPSLAAYTNLAVAYWRIGDAPQAIAMARQALKLAQAEGETQLAAQLEAAIRTYEARATDQSSAR